MEAEDKLREPEQRYRALYESIKDGIVRTDLQGNIQECNQAYADMFDYSKEEIKKLTYQQLTPQKWQIIEENIVNNQILPKGYSDEYEKEYIKKNGTIFPVTIRVWLIKDTQGNPTGMWGFIRDITERKKMEDVLKKAYEQLSQLNKIKSDFVSIVSHELRTPLSVVREAVSQVLDGVCGEINQEQKDFLSMSIESVDRLSRLIENLLDISKMEIGKIELKRELIDIIGLVQEVCSHLETIARNKNLQIKINFPKEKIKLYLDKDRIIQVFTNLINNALKFTDKGYIEISIIDKEKMAECYVSDTGVGIAEQDLPKVFSKFEQFAQMEVPQDKGTGLGLAISKGIVELHKGKIWVESKLGQGTKFTCTLPKFGPIELFKEYIVNGLEKAIKQDTTFSAVIFDIKNYPEVKEKLGKDKTNAIVYSLEQLTKTNLRRKADTAIADTRAILMVLPETDKKGAWAVVGRFQTIFMDYLSREGLDKEVEITSGVVNFPEDANTEQEFFSKIAEIITIK